ncbi:DinB family protein [Cellulomonas sp. SG140]|uniref:DinB family protein n=1 Tax=Cellulomonas sp. SG140 TaxID=2976536 RepID=UPI0021E70BB0|nr:DinB family protein [Cellulomonas sp. SG140]
MATPREDLAGLFDYAWQRFSDRMAGVSPEEWVWAPLADTRVCLRWRFGHLAHLLADGRNSAWLGLGPRPEVPAHGEEPATVHGDLPAALEDLQVSFRRWRDLLDQTTDASLAEPIGAVGGPYGQASRYSYALHVLDELIHHTAEAALLRDLYAGSRGARAATTS